MPAQSQSVKRIFWTYLFALGSAGILLAAYATSTYGAGVGTDGAIQLSTADNLLQGKGFYDYAGQPFVRWPPLYPIVLAGLSRLAGLDTFRAGWILNLFLFGAIVWLGGAILYRCFRDEPLWAFLGSLVMAASVSLLGICANIGTDPLFTALALAFLLLADRYLKAESPGSLFGMALLACLASLQRLPGVALIAAGAVLILYAARKNVLRGIRGGVFFAALTILPLAYWVVGHNYLQNRTLFGVYLFESTLPLLNLQSSLVKMLHWFVPYPVLERIPSILFTGVPVLALALASRRRDWLRLGGRLSGPPALPALVFAGLYLAFLVFTANSVDTRDALYDRYHVVILVPVLILIFSALQDLVILRIQPRPGLARLLVLAVFAAWLVYPVHNLYKYASLSRSEGVVTYNRYNTRTLRQSQVVRILQEIDDHDGRAIYSNYPAAAWFYTRRDVYESPRGAIVGDFNVQELLEAYRGWPWEEPGYLVWFLPNEYDHVLEPKDLKRLSDLQPVYRGEDGEIYRVRAR